MPSLDDTDIMAVALFLFLILFLNAPVFSGLFYRILAGFVGLGFGLYVYTLTANLILAAAFEVTFLLLITRNIGDMVDARREGTD